MVTKIDRAITEAINSLEPKMLKAFLDSFADIRSSVRVNTVTRALRAGRIEDALRALHVSPEFFAPMDAAITQAFREGGVSLFSGLPRLIDGPAGPQPAPRFNMRAPRAEAWMRTRIDVLASNISREQGALVREAIVTGLNTGRSSSSLALDIVGRINPVNGIREGGTLGLAPNQTKYVNSAREELLSGDPKLLRNYLKRAQRDKRFDNTVKAAIKSGKPIPKKIVNSATTKYSNRLLRARGKVIAHHETVAAVNAGKHEGMRQIVDSGSVEAQQVTRKWVTQGDSRVRDAHASMNGQTVKGIDTPFISGTGARLKYPHDSSLGAGADDVANCRCFESVSIKQKSVIARVTEPTEAGLQTGVVIGT